MDIKDPPKVWTHDFIRIYISNLLLFTSLYMLLPVLPIYIVGKFSTSLSTAGLILSLFALPLFFVGPFYSYLIDTYKRKTVCLLSYLFVIAILGGYFIVGSLIWMAVLRMMQGVLFGITTSMSSTLAIDITASARRSEGNVYFSWAARLGMVIGPMIGLLFFRYEGLEVVLYASILLGILGLILISLIRVAFRAPIGSSLCSLDRFFLPQGWLPSLNLVLVSFTFGMLLTTINMYTESTQMQDVAIRFFVLMAGGFILAMIANRTVFVHADLPAKVTSGLILMGASLLLVMTHAEQLAFIWAAVLMGLGLGLVASEFLLILIKLTEHCQRGTANTTYLLAWELGVALGVVTGCYLIDVVSFISVFQVSIVAIVLAMILYLVFTNPYFCKNKVR